MINRRVLYLILFLIGCLQMIGATVGSSTLKGIGLASVASPLPLVFSHFRSIETFAADFQLRLKNKDKIIYDTPINSALYSKLKGPYNRRNIYGAVFAYGPALTRPAERVLVLSVLKQGFCNGGPLAAEFDLPTNFDEVEIVVHTKTASNRKSHRLGVHCA